MVAVSTWADNFGNWHALVTGDLADNGKEQAYVAIRDELKARMNPDHFGEDRYSVTLVFQNGEQTEWVETWEGEGIPTRSDVVTCGECGKSFPPNVAPSSRCPYEYDDHEPEEKVNHYEFLVTVTAVDGAEYSGLANADELGDCVDELVESAHLDGFEIAGVSAVKR